MPDEEQLSGGNWNAPVRRGSAVHRESGPWSASVHALLRHVHDRGIDWLPEPLGFDEQGREMLSFLPGDVPQYPMPEWLWSKVFDRNTLLRRLDLLCGAYGDGADSGAVLHALPARLRELADSAASRADERPELGAHAELYRRDAARMEQDLLDSESRPKDRPPVRPGRSPRSGYPERERGAGRG